jgi:hypothetical protein
MSDTTSNHDGIAGGVPPPGAATRPSESEVRPIGDEEREGQMEAARRHYKNWLNMDWFTFRPHEYPPNFFPRVQTVDGEIVRRDFLPVVPVKEEQYLRYLASDTTYVSIIWELTPKGSLPMDGPRMFLEEGDIDADSRHLSFASCHSCWKSGRRNFDDPNRTPHPKMADLDDPNLARLGGCGCICCNQCVRDIEMHESNLNNDAVHCPYCGNLDCFSKELRIWVVNQEVKDAFERFEINQVLRDVSGRQELKFNIVKAGEGHMLCLD